MVKAEKGKMKQVCKEVRDRKVKEKCRTAQPGIHVHQPARIEVSRPELFSKMPGPKKMGQNIVTGIEVRKKRRNRENSPGNYYEDVMTISIFRFIWHTLYQ
jgi:hypothetical protein